MLWPLLRDGEMMGFSNVDLPVAFWKVLCSRWSHSYKRKHWPHPGWVTAEVKGDGVYHSPSSHPDWSHLDPLDAPFFLRWFRRSLRLPSVVGPTYTGPGDKLTLEAQRRVEKWGAYLETSPRFCQFSELRVDPVPDMGAGASPGKGTWTSRSGVGVGGLSKLNKAPRVGKSRPRRALLSKLQPGTGRPAMAAPSIPHYVKSALCHHSPQLPVLKRQHNGPSVVRLFD